MGIINNNGEGWAGDRNHCMGSTAGWVDDGYRSVSRSGPINSGINSLGHSEWNSLECGGGGGSEVKSPLNYHQLLSALSTPTNVNSLSPLGWLGRERGVDAMLQCVKSRE